MPPGSVTHPAPGKRYSVERGASLAAGAGLSTSFDTLRYNFKPASAAAADRGRLRLSSGGHVKLSTIPTASAGGVIFDGNSEDHRHTAFALVCDRNGIWRLERLQRSIKNLAHRRATAEARPPPPPAAPQPTDDDDEDAGVDEGCLFGQESDDGDA
mmetsp:Transcript_38210/g.76554  ORF Transcript_38210/g.76554 Transcript_38210/m.76554 type:complete len:156 (-) Transcript_38210:90-557(-)